MLNRIGTFGLSAAALLAFGLAGGVPLAHAQGVPGSDRNICLAGKTSCVNDKVSGLLKCRERCQKNIDRCGAAQTECETKVRNRFDGGANPEKSCFARLEANQDPSRLSR